MDIPGMTPAEAPRGTYDELKANGVIPVQSGMDPYHINVGDLAPEAPKDHKAYARKDEAWVEVEANDVFVATPDTTTAEELIEAIDAGKTIAINLVLGRALVSHAFYEDDFVGLNFAGFPFSPATQPGLFVYRISRADDTWELALCHPWEAPRDGKQYARKNGDWEEVTGGVEVLDAVVGSTTALELMAAIDTGKTIRIPAINAIVTGANETADDVVLSLVGFPDGKTKPGVYKYAVSKDTNEWAVSEPHPFEAPKDGRTYGRKDGSWTEVTGGGASIGEITYGTSSYDETLAILEHNAVSVLTAEDVRMVVAQWFTDEDDSLHIIVANNNGQGVVQVTSSDVWSVHFSAFVEDAPDDGKQYARKNKDWTEVDAVEEAPEDGKTYGRKDDGWVEITGGSGDVFTVEDEVTPYADITAAIADGKLLLLKKAGGDKLIPVTGYLDTDHNRIHLYYVNENLSLVDIIIGSDDEWNEVITYSLDDAPNDAKLYGRKYGTWVEVPGGASIGEVTLGTSTYAEVVAAFENNTIVLLTAGNEKGFVASHYVNDSDVQMLICTKWGQIVFKVTTDDEWSGEIYDFLTEAPNDNKMYGRKNKVWTEITGGASIGEVTYDTSTYAEVVAAFENNDFVKVNSGIVKMLIVSHDITDDVVNMLAVGDHANILLKVTSEGVWSAEDVGLIQEAPEDGKQYARKDGDWAEVVCGDVSSGLIKYGETTAEQAKSIMSSAFIAKKFPVVRYIPGISGTNHAVLALSILGYGSGDVHQQVINCLVLPDTTYPQLRVVTIKVDETTDEWSVMASRDFTPDLNDEERASGKAYVRAANAWGNPVWARLVDPVFNVVLGTTEVADIVDAINANRPLLLYIPSDVPTPLDRAGTFAVAHASVSESDQPVLEFVNGTTYVTVTIAALSTFLFQSKALITEAPNDGQLYGRRNGEWVVIP